MGCAKWHHHHLAKRERLWDWDRSNALCTLYILLVILVYLSDVFISLDCFFTECSISLWIKEVWIILFTFFSFIVFQTMNFASYALSHLLCTLLVLNLAIFATQNFAGIYFCNLNKKNMKKGIKFSHKFLYYLEQAKRKLSANKVTWFWLLKSGPWPFCLLHYFGMVLYWLS